MPTNNIISNTNQLLQVKLTSERSFQIWPKLLLQERSVKSCKSFWLISAVPEHLDVEIYQKQPMLKSQNDASSLAHGSIAEEKTDEMGVMVLPSG